MSQSFELLNQLEAEFGIGGTAPMPVTESAQTAEEAVLPSVSQGLLNLAQTLFLSGNTDAPHKVVLCGVDHESSSSAICAQLGRVLASAGGKPVCIVDAGISPSRLSSLLGKARSFTPAAPAGEAAEQEVEKNLWLTRFDAFNSPHGDGPVPVDQFKQRLEKLGESFSFILVDAPGVNERGDAAVLSQAADGTVLIVEANATRRAAALKATKTLKAMNIRLFGCVLNNRTFPIPQKLYRKL